MAKRKQPEEPAVSRNDAPLPIRDTTYWLALTTTQCLALADGVVTPEVQRMANMIDKPSLVQGQMPYGVVFVPKD